MPTRCLAPLIVVVLLAGCSGNRIREGEFPSYRAGRTQSAMLDVQVVRTGRDIHLTNTTARTLPDSTMWINAWYSHPFESLGVGESRKYDLGVFRDEYGVAFDAGGFFAVQKPDKVVLVQLEYDDALWGLVVVGDQEETE